MSEHGITKGTVLSAMALPWQESLHASYGSH